MYLIHINFFHMKGFRKKVPVFLQLSAVECGAACLAMILNYFGKKISLTECREKCNPGRDGLSAKDIAVAARYFGLQVKAYSVKFDAFQYVSLPAITHWKFNHFVVVEKWTKRFVYIVDPALGKRTLTHNEFEESFTGIVLTFEHASDISSIYQSNNDFSWITYLRNILKHLKLFPIILQIALASLLLQIFGLAFPYFTKILIDDILPHYISDILPLLGIGMILIFMAQATVAYIRSVLLIQLRMKLDFNLMISFFRHLISLPFSFYQKRTVGDLLLRLNSNSVIREVLSSQIISLLLDAVFALVYLIILIKLSFTYTVIAVIFSILQIAVILFTKDLIYQYNQKDLSTKADEQSYLVEVMKGVGFIKASGTNEYAYDRWSRLFYDQLKTSYDKDILSAKIDTPITFIRSISQLVFLWYGATQVLNGNLSLGSMLALNYIGSSLLSPISSIVLSGQQVQIVSAHLERLQDVLQTKPEQADTKHTKKMSEINSIEFRNVNFSYDKSLPTLENISFSIKSGEKLAIVGKTGSGKSTVIKLLLGLYSPSSGELLFNHIPLHQFDYTSVRQKFGIVLQEPLLFSGSIRQNITFNNPNSSLTEIVSAAQNAMIHDEILEMPMMYETYISEGGNNLSGGQQQRIAIARALINSPSILIFDEATSNLDAVTEAQIEKNLSTLNITRIIVAHRLSTIKDANRILVFDSGSLVETGTHEELMLMKGYYANLIMKQTDNSKPN